MKSLNTLNKQSYCRSLLLTMPLVLNTSVTVAQNTNENSLFDLSISDLMSLKVTAASLFEESELDAASSITLLTANDWKKSNPHRVSDVLENVPSVASYPTWGGAEAIAIRGYATELSVRGIANTLNGIPLNTYTYATSQYDKPIINLDHLERIEVVRGPGSTLYGSDAFHGVMARKIRHKNNNTQSLSTGFGTNGFAKASTFFSNSMFKNKEPGDFFANNNIGKVQINGGLAFQRQSPMGLPYQYTSPDDGLIYHSDRDYQYNDSSAFLTLSTGDKNKFGEFELTNYFSSFNANGYPSSGTQFFVKLPLAFELESPSLTEDLDHSSGDSQFWLTGLNYKFSLTQTTELEVRAYHWQNKQKWSYENDRYPTVMTHRRFGPLPCRNATNGSPNPIYCPHTLYQGSNEQRSGLQLYVKGQNQGTHWVLGVGRDRFEINNSKYARIALDDSELINEDNPYNGSIRNITHALAQAKTAFRDNQLQLIYGLRWDHYSDLDNHISPRLGAIYNINDHFTTKLLYGHAYRAPTALERLGSVDSVVANEDIKPEEIDTIEWVNVLYDKDYSLELTAFASRWQDGIVLTPIVDQRNQYVNTGKNESYGMEMLARKQYRNYNFNASGSYIKSENKEFNIDYLAFPKWIFTLQAGRLLPEENIEIKFTQRIMLKHTEGDYITVIDGNSGSILNHIKPKQAKDYFRTNLSLVKHFSKLTADTERSIVLTLRNLFDQDNEVASLYNAESSITEEGFSLDLSLNWTW